MKLLIINGSPKLGVNNTSVLLDKFVVGFMENPNNSFQIYRMNTAKSYEEGANKFCDADNILIAFPLYCYSMPSGVKTFIENLEPYIKSCHNKRIGFLVQYGFAEATHARPLEKYLIYLCKILGCEYMGMIIKGGCDGLSRNTRGSDKILQGIYEIGKEFGMNEKFDQEQLKRYSEPEMQKKINPFLVKIIFWAINKFYWQKSLKKNGVSLKASFAKPYAKSAE